MGIFDDLSSTLNKGKEATTRNAQILKLKAQIADLNNQRNGACAKLGAELYEKTKDYPALKEGLEDQYAEIEKIDERVVEMRAQIASLEEAGQVARNPAQYMTDCPGCGYHLEEGVRFCPNCGAAVSQETSV